MYLSPDQLRAALASVADKALVEKLVEEHFRQLPKKAPVAGFYSPEPAPPKTAEKSYRERMANASSAFAAALETAARGGDPQTSTTIKWSLPTGADAITTGKARVCHLETKPARPARANPCARCGVRESQHENLGCKHYTARVAV